MTGNPFESSNISAPTNAQTESPTGFPIHAVSVRTELEGGEIVLLAIKPSPWSMIYATTGWIAAAIVIQLFERIALAAPPSIAGFSPSQIAIAVACLRFVIAVVQWVSRVYVLTNRRVMRIRGVTQADVFERPLLQVINTGVIERSHEKAVGVGSIWFNVGDAEQDGTWYHVAKPHLVHEAVRRAIEKALDHHG